MIIIINIIRLCWQSIMTKSDIMKINLIIKIIMCYFNNDYYWCYFTVAKLNMTKSNLRKIVIYNYY